MARKQPGMGQGKRATFPHSKGPKLPQDKRTDGGTNWTQWAASLAKARRDKTHLIYQIFKPDPIQPGYRRHRGAIALSEICHYQKTTKFLIPLAPFMRLVREILCNGEIIGRNDWRIQSSALVVLQTVAEAFLIGHFKDARLCTIHAKWVNVMPKDTHLALQICRDKVVGHNIESIAQLSGAKGMKTK